MALSEYEKKLLEVVLETAGDIENEVPRGIRKALARFNEHTPGRTGYLCRILEKAATAKIRQARRRAERRAQKKLS